MLEGRGCYALIKSYKQGSLYLVKVPTKNFNKEAEEEKYEEVEVDLA